MSDTTYLCIGDNEEIELRLECDGSQITIWGYSARISKLHPRPSWVEVADFDAADYGVGETPNDH